MIPPIKSVGHGITCTDDLLSKDEVRHVLMELSQEVGLKLRKNKLAATRVRISVRDNTLSHREYQGKLTFPTQSYTEIAAAGFELFCKKHTWNNNIRSLTISAIDLIPSDTPIQLDLWSDFTKHNKRLILERTMEDIRRRYGLHSINFAALTTGLKMPAIGRLNTRCPLLCITEEVLTINAAVETTQARHPILSNGYGSIQIDGFSGLIPKKCFCIMADGHRYQEHGISTGSVLFCQRAAEINDGDLIVVKENGAFALYLYLKDRKVKADGEKRILHNKSKAYAKVLGSFNFYH